MIGISAQNPCQLTEAEWRIYASVSQVIIGPLIMAWRQFSAKPLSEAIFIVWSAAPLGTKDARKCIWKCHLQNGIYFASASVCSIKSSEIWFVQNTHFCCRIIFKLQVTQNLVLIQPYSVQNFKMIWQPNNKLRQSNISLDYGDP